MTVSLSQQQIDTLYPAHIFVDPLLQITGLGPSLRRRAPWLTIGSPLFAHFRSATGQEVRDLEPLARNSTAIVLAAREHRLMLAGIALHLAEGYLLTLNHVPSGDEIDLEVSDFAPGDPHLSNLLLIRVQNALIEESSAVASELTLERQRVVDVIDRVGRMSGYLAHDLNNFLSVISLNAKRLLRTEMRDERQRHCVDVIVETAERCSEFTQGMMTLANQKSDSRLPFPIDKIIAEASALFRSACGTRIELQVSLDSTGAIVNAASNGLVNSIINLLINSRQAMPAGGTISLSTQVICASEIEGTGAPPSGKYVAITIADQGSGMPPDVLDRAFELFFSTKDSGTGVGLASVRDFAEQMEGWVGLSSIEGLGTTVSLYLPLVEQNHAANDDEPLVRIEEQPTRRKVLVVDDEDYALEALAEFLEDEDYCVTTARDAAEARQRLEQDRHDVLVTDVIMHGVDGIDLAHWAARHQPGLHVILMSGFVPDAAQLSSDWLFIRKPIDPDMLCRLIEAR